jgi:hypothetical protein
MVFVASSSAGLRPGKNFNTPNQRKTIPNATRSTKPPWRVIHRVTRTSRGPGKVLTTTHLRDGLIFRHEYRVTGGARIRNR